MITIIGYIFVMVLIIFFVCILLKISTEKARKEAMLDSLKNAIEEEEIERNTYAKKIEEVVKGWSIPNSVSNIDASFASQLLSGEITSKDFKTEPTPPKDGKVQ